MFKRIKDKITKPYRDQIAEHVANNRRLQEEMFASQKASAIAHDQLQATRMVFAKKESEIQRTRQMVAQLIQDAQLVIDKGWNEIEPNQVELEENWQKAIDAAG